MKIFGAPSLSMIPKVLAELSIVTFSRLDTLIVNTSLSSSFSSSIIVIDCDADKSPAKMVKVEATSL